MPRTISAQILTDINCVLRLPFSLSQFHATGWKRGIYRYINLFQAHTYDRKTTKDLDTYVSSKAVFTCKFNNPFLWKRDLKHISNYSSYYNSIFLSAVADKIIFDTEPKNVIFTTKMVTSLDIAILAGNSIDKGLQHF